MCGPPLCSLRPTGYGITALSAAALPSVPSICIVYIILLMLSLGRVTLCNALYYITLRSTHAAVPTTLRVPITTAWGSILRPGATIGVAHGQYGAAR